MASLFYIQFMIAFRNFDDDDSNNNITSPRYKSNGMKRLYQVTYDLVLNKIDRGILIILTVIEKKLR